MQILCFWLLSPPILFLQLLNVLGGDRKSYTESRKIVIHVYLSLASLVAQTEIIKSQILDFFFSHLLLLLCSVYLALCVQMIYIQMHMMFFPLALLLA